MKHKKIIFAGIAAIAVFLIRDAIYANYLKTANNQFEENIISQDSYQQAAEEIAGKINLLSPTPPLSESWYVSEAEFVPDTPYAYVTYHDTYNFSRILIQSGTKNNQSTYRTIATFKTGPERDGSVWQLNNGTDINQQTETINYFLNPETNVWERKEDTSQ